MSECCDQVAAMLQAMRLAVCPPSVSAQWNYGSNAASTSGALLTSGVSPHAKGEWVELTPATESDTAWLLAQFGPVTSAGHWMIDIARGDAAETIIVSDLYVRARWLGPGTGPYLMPVSIPAGERLWARCAHTWNDFTCQVSVSLIAGPQFVGPQPEAIDTFGSGPLSFGTLVDPGPVANTKSDWVELVTETERSYQWIVLALGSNDSTWSGAQSWLVDLRIGDDVVIRDLLFTGDNVADYVNAGPVVALPFVVPIGISLSVRAQSSTNVASDRNLYAMLYCS